MHNKLAVIALALMMGMAGWLNGAEIAPAAPSTAASQVVTLDYQPSTEPLARWYLPTEGEPRAFRKEPALRTSGVYRGRFFFSSQTNHPVAFIWDQRQRKLYVDLNGNLDLSDDPVFSTASRNLPHLFIDVPLKLPTPSGPHPCKVNLLLSLEKKYAKASVMLGSYWQGGLTLNGHPWKIAVTEDLNSHKGPNTLCGLLLGQTGSKDPAGNPWQSSSDWIRFNRKLFFEGQAWQMDVVFDGTNKTPHYVFNLVPQKLALGELNLKGSGISRLVLENEGGYTVVLEHPSRTEKVPAGLYCVRRIWLQDGRTEALSDTSRMVAVRPASRTDLAVGGPLTNSVALQAKGARLFLKYEALGAQKETYRVWRAGVWQPPEFAIYHNNLEVGSGTFQFNPETGYTYSWRVPFYLAGTVNAVARQDLEGLGARVSPPNEFRWGMPTIGAHLLPFLLVLLLLWRESNRKARAWIIWIPVFLVMGADVWLADRFNQMPWMVFQACIYPLAIGFAALWLLSPGLVPMPRATSTFFAFITVFVFGVGAAFLRGEGMNLIGSIWDRVQAIGISAALLAVALTAAWFICRGRHNRLGYLIWLFVCLAILWIVVVAIACYPALRDGTAEMLQFILAVCLGTLVTFVMTLPFFLFIFASPFYAERFDELFHLGDAHEARLAAAIRTRGTAGSFEETLDLWDRLRNGVMELVPLVLFLGAIWFVESRLAQKPAAAQMMAEAEPAIEEQVEPQVSTVDQADLEFIAKHAGKEASEMVNSFDSSSTPNLALKIPRTPKTADVPTPQVLHTAVSNLTLKAQIFSTLANSKIFFLKTNTPALAP